MYIIILHHDFALWFSQSIIFCFAISMQHAFTSYKFTNGIVV